MIFRCGLGLNSWQPTDVPLMEHARFSPRCAFLLRITGGRTFARDIVAGDLERRAQRSAHDTEELRTALREFSDAIGIVLLLINSYYLSHFLYYLMIISAIARCILNIPLDALFRHFSHSTHSLTHTLSLFSSDIQCQITLRHVDQRELRARCDMEVFRAINEILQIPMPIVSLAIECQLILFRMCSYCKSVQHMQLSLH